MKYIKYLLLALLITIPYSVFAGTPLTQSDIDFLTTDKPHDDVYAVYDLRDRNSYLQITRSDDRTEISSENPLCIHVQIFQQDKGCVELDFEDELTPNDTVIYDMDNIVRNDGTPVPINLDDDSYGFVAISTFDCDDRDSDPGDLLGNFRIIDDAGYEYRMNLISGENSNDFLDSDTDSSPPAASGNLLIPFNTVEGANQADVIVFLTEDDREINGSSEGPSNDTVYNEEVGVTFSVFMLDENEERLSCDRKTIGCGPDVVFNYGINEDYPASRGNNLLCEGAGLLPDQKHGYISLENATFLSPLDSVPDPLNSDFEMVCVYGLNNGDGTGSMDECLVRCNFGILSGTDGECADDPNDN